MLMPGWKVFTAISTVDVGTILSCSDEELRPILACLVRMSLIAPLDHSPECLQERLDTLIAATFSVLVYK